MNDLTLSSEETQLLRINVWISKPEKGSNFYVNIIFSDSTSFTGTKTEWFMKEKWYELLESMGIDNPQGVDVKTLQKEVENYSGIKWNLSLVFKLDFSEE